MYIDIVPNRGSPPAILLRESIRDGKRVRKRTIANLPVDLTANCLELWLVAPDGREGPRALVHAEIVLVPDGEGDVEDDDADDDEIVVTVPGCD